MHIDAVRIRSFQQLLELNYICKYECVSTLLYRTLLSVGNTFGFRRKLHF